MPALARGKSGMVSSLAIGHHVGWGPPARRPRAENPGIIEINSHWQPPESGETDFAGYPPGNLPTRPTFREISRGVPHPGKFPGEFPGVLGVPLEISWGAPHPGTPRGIRARQPDFSAFGHSARQNGPLWALRRNWGKQLQRDAKQLMGDAEQHNVRPIWNYRKI